MEKKSGKLHSKLHRLRTTSPWPRPCVTKDRVHAHDRVDNSILLGLRTATLAVNSVIYLFGEIKNDKPLSMQSDILSFIFTLFGFKLGNSKISYNRLVSRSST